MYPRWFLWVTVVTLMLLLLPVVIRAEDFTVTEKKFHQERTISSITMDSYSFTVDEGQAADVNVKVVVGPPLNIYTMNQSQLSKATSGEYFDAIWAYTRKSRIDFSFTITDAGSYAVAVENIARIEGNNTTYTIDINRSQQTSQQVDRRPQIAQQVAGYICGALLIFSIVLGMIIRWWRVAHALSPATPPSARTMYYAPPTLAPAPPWPQPAPSPYPTCPACGRAFMPPPGPRPVAVPCPYCGNQITVY